MAQGKKSFIAYADWKDVFDVLPNEDAGALIKHIFSYVNDENPVTDSVLINAVFANIKTTLKRDLEKWESQLEQRREAGRRSAEQRQSKLNGSSTVVDGTTRNSTVNENVNVNVTVTDIKETHTGKSKRFIPPSKIEIEEFCFDNLIEIDIGHFIDHYTANGWKVGKNTMKDWKATVRNWNRNKDNFKNNNNGKRTNDDGTALINWVNGN